MSGPQIQQAGNTSGIHAHDADWQFPAITEQHAFRKIAQLGGLPEGFTYVAFPWATLIDKHERKTADLAEMQAAFEKFSTRIPRGTVTVTVCQHIHFDSFIHLFEKAGINHVFWSHARSDAKAPTGRNGMTIHPFPLYPVQRPSPDAARPSERQYLCSFIGARANKWYMTKSRNWILDLMKDHPQSLVIGRDEWHFQKIVYDHQVLQIADSRENLVDSEAADQFLQVMLQSTFSLCPSGTGPNSIRLWETLCTGSIPVILSDKLALPGPAELWNQAAVFCKETPTAVKALPARLEEIAADPKRLAAMRHATQQLSLLYGPEIFVGDILELVLADVRHRQAPTAKGAVNYPGTIRKQLTRKPGDATRYSRENSRFIVASCASYLLLNHSGMDHALSPGTPLNALVRKMCRTLGDSDAMVQHFERVLRQRGISTGPAAPACIGTRLRVFLFGRHCHRTPLAYAPYRQLLDDDLTWAECADKADVLITGYFQDLLEEKPDLDRLYRRDPDLRVAVISEEPLWDTIWSKGFTDRARVLDPEGSAVPFTFLNHQTSEIFAFERLPYFITTDDRFIARYWALFANTTRLTQAQWRSRWQDAAICYAFYAEKRDNPAYDQSWEALDIYGLSGFRTRVAEDIGTSGRVAVGRGWLDAMPRQELVDWHLDKLAALDGRAAIVSGLENTHHRHYLSEKIFDAYSVGAVPVYHASPEHRIFELVHPASMINCFGKNTSESAEIIRSFRPEPDFLDAYVASHAKLARLFSDSKALASERWRVSRAVLGEIERIYDNERG